MGLDTVEFVLLAEKEFGVKLSDSEVGMVATVGEFTELIHQKLLPKYGLEPCPHQDEIYNRIKNLLIMQFAIPEAKVSRNARFTDDLQMD